MLPKGEGEQNQYEGVGVTLRELVSYVGRKNVTCLPGRVREPFLMKGHMTKNAEKIHYYHPIRIVSYIIVLNMCHN